MVKQFSAILENPHFNNLASILRKPFWSSEWKREHPSMAFWQLLESLNKAKMVRVSEFTTVFCNLLIALTEADQKLSYTVDDLTWFVEVMDSKYALTIASLLLAWVSAPEK